MTYKDRFHLIPLKFFQEIVYTDFNINLEKEYLQRTWFQPNRIICRTHLKSYDLRTIYCPITFPEVSPLQPLPRKRNLLQQAFRQMKLILGRLFQIPNPMIGQSKLPKYLKASRESNTLVKESRDPNNWVNQY